MTGGLYRADPSISLDTEVPLLLGLDLSLADLDRELSWVNLPPRVARALQGLWIETPGATLGSTFRLRDFAEFTLSDLLNVRHVGVGTLAAVRPAIEAALVQMHERGLDGSELSLEDLFDDGAEKRIDPDVLAVYGATKRIVEIFRVRELTSISALAAYLQADRLSRRNEYYSFRYFVASLEEYNSLREFATSLAMQVEGREIATLESLYQTRLQAGPVDWPCVIMERFGVHAAVEGALPGLEREVRAFEMRSDGMTLEQVGKQLGVTRERARQLVKKVTPYVGSEWVKQSVEGPRRHLLSERENEVARRHALSEAARVLVLERPGIALFDLAKHLGLDEQEARRAVPDYLTKFVLGHAHRHGMAPVPRHSKEQLLAAVRHAGTFYFPLSAPQYDDLVALGEIDAPGSQTVAKRFGTWKAACLAAGVEPFSIGRSLYETKWSWDEVVNFIVEYLMSPETTGTFADYEQWRSRQVNAAPSGALVRKTLNSWGDAVGIALLKISEAGPLNAEKFGKSPIPGGTQ